MCGDCDFIYTGFTLGISKTSGDAWHCRGSRSPTVRTWVAGTARGPQPLQRASTAK